MSHSSAPELKLPLNIRQGCYSTESPETYPVKGPKKTDATSSETTLKTGKRRDDCTESCSFKIGISERSEKEGDVRQIDNTRMESIEPASSPCLSSVRGSNVDVLSHIGFSFIGSTLDEQDPSSTKIQNWNCHLCCKINEIEAENPQTWADVGSDHCTNFGCRHPRCSDCYYLNWAWQPLQFCDGRPADRESYEDWYNTFERV